jgi:glyoxylase-like metal-dependent hydrolase (beta-lactamase superfamily II)
MKLARPAVFYAAAVTLVLGAGLVHRLHAQQNFDNVSITATHVAGNIHMLTGAGGNIGVSAGADGLLVVDDQFAPLAGKIRAALKGINPGKVAFVLNTHYHGDHVGGNEALGKEGTIIAHDNVRKRLVSGHQPFGGEAQSVAAGALPVVTYSQSVTLHFNGEAIEVIHFPGGHTDGDSVVFFTGANVVHMGDHLFVGMYPFVDLSAGGSVQGMAANIEAVLARIGPDTKVIPGHGPLSGAAELRSALEMLRETLAVVRAARGAGKSLEEVKAAGLPAKWDAWGKGFIKPEQWIETLYRTLDGATAPAPQAPAGVSRSDS